jgi:hypothetical protein
MTMEDFILEHDAAPHDFRHSDLATEAKATTEAWHRYEATPLTPDGYRTLPVIEMLYVPALGRAGLACGGDAVWTFAEDPHDALERYLGRNGKELED